MKLHQFLVIINVREPDLFSAVEYFEDHVLSKLNADDKLEAIYDVSDITKAEVDLDADYPQVKNKKLTKLEISQIKKLSTQTTQILELSRQEIKLIKCPSCSNNVVKMLFACETCGGSGLIKPKPIVKFRAADQPLGYNQNMVLNWINNTDGQWYTDFEILAGIKIATRRIGELRKVLAKLVDYRLLNRRIFNLQTSYSKVTDDSN